MRHTLHKSMSYRIIQVSINIFFINDTHVDIICHMFYS